MSVILITDHNECIYDVKKVEPIIYEKPPQYISKYNSSIKEKSAEKWHNKRHETMGIPEEDLPDPKEFLKKHTGQPAYTRAQLKNETSVVKAKQPNVPTLEECKKDFKKAKSSMNFVNKNIKTVKSMKAKEPVPKVVIDCYGTKKLLAHGMEPVFVKSSMFGKTPMYLKRFMKCREKHEQIEKEIENLEQKKCRYIRKDEREALLNGLKENWKELQKQYQLLPILTDTIPKINRRVKLEKDLAEIEKDIKLLEKHPYIYVYDEETLSENQ